ncbi:MAG: hypothetical protein PVF22_08040 [Candidatus Aminicenantes bacterium]|jgi:hypothetical protein
MRDELLARDLNLWWLEGSAFEELREFLLALVILLGFSLRLSLLTLEELLRRVLGVPPARVDLCREDNLLVEI